MLSLFNPPSGPPVDFVLDTFSSYEYTRSKCQTELRFIRIEYTFYKGSIFRRVGGKVWYKGALLKRGKQLRKVWTVITS